MNTEKLEKLKKSLDNKFIPDNMKDKIRAEIKKLEADIKTDETITATEVKEEVKEIEKKVEKALEVAEEKEEQAEAKAEEKKEKAPRKAREKKATQSETKTPKVEPKSTAKKKSVFSIAKEIRKDNESWEDAKERARKMMKSETTETKKKTRTETDKLLAMVRRNKEYKKLAGTSNLPKDASRRALPRGKRVSQGGWKNQYGESEGGNVYYENRANRVDVGGFKNAYLENGGVTKNYINRNQLNTITIKKGDKKLTYKVSDVYNGAYKLEDGGNLERTAFYVSKRNVVKVQLKDGKDVKVANGYWIKKGAKPIHTSKYDDGGMTEKGNNLDYKLIKSYWGNKKEEEFSENEFKKYIEKNEIKNVWIGLKKIDYFKFDSHEGRMIMRYSLKKNSTLKYYVSFLNHSVALKNNNAVFLEDINYEDYKNSILTKKTLEILNYKNNFEGGGKTTFNEKATAIAKNFEGKKVEPKYQKEYGKTYDKAEAKEVGNKIAGSQKAKYDSKMSGGGSTKRGGAMQLAKQIRKDGESWQSALKRANEQMRNK